jgi:hypothetical protein
MDAEGSGDKESVQIIQQNIKQSLHLLDVDAKTSLEITSSTTEVSGILENQLPD